MDAILIDLMFNISVFKVSCFSIGTLKFKIDKKLGALILT
jgi:hypothetical protein